MFIFGTQVTDEFLNNSLEAFITEEVELSEAELTENIQFAKKVIDSLEARFNREKSLANGIQTSSVFLMKGSTVEKHKVGDAKDIDVDINLTLDVEDKLKVFQSGTGSVEVFTANLIETEVKEKLETLASQGLLTRKTEESNYEIVRDVFWNLFLDAMSRTFRQEERIEDLGYNFTIKASRPVLQVDIITNDRSRNITLNMRPVLQLSKRDAQSSYYWFWAAKNTQPSKLYPQAQGWQQCYEEEIEIVSKLKPAQLIMLKLLKTLGRTDSPLSKLSSYTYKSFIIGISLASFWSAKDRAHDFKQTVLQLKNHLAASKIAHFHDPNINLLDDLDRASVIYLHNYLKDIVEEGSYLELLEANRTKHPREDIYFEENLELERFQRDRMPVQDINFIGEYLSFEEAFSQYLKEYFDSDDVFQRTRLKYLSTFIKSYLSDELRLKYDSKLRPELFIVFDLNDDVWQAVEYEASEQMGTKGFGINRIDSNRDVNSSEIGNTQAKRYGAREAPNSLDSENFYKVIRKEITSAFHLRSEIAGFKVRVASPTGHFQHIDIVANYQQRASHDTVKLRLFPAMTFNCPQNKNIIFYSMGKYNNPLQWRKSWHEPIRTRLSSMDQMDGGSRNNVMKILLCLKAMTPLNKLKETVFVTILLKAQSKHWWSEKNTANMLNQILDRLWVALTRRILYQSLDKDVNLMNAYGSETFDRFIGYLGRYKTNNGFKLDLLFNDLNNGR